MSTAEYDYEPVPGLPGHLPAGETLLWQGRPLWWALAKQALRIRIVAAYFLALALWQAGSAFAAGHSAGSILYSLRLPLLLGATACAVLLLIAWAAARATIYSITNRRVVIRHGIALPMSLNLPFAQIEAAALRRCRDGSGELALRLPKQQRVGYLLTWPHVRPGRYVQPQPALRALEQPAEVARVLGAALQGVTDIAPVRQAAPTELRAPGAPPRATAAA